MGNFSDIFNLLLGLLSVGSLFYGYINEESRVLFWIFGIALLIFTLSGYYIFDNKNKVDSLINKFKKIEESLNIYDRLNKLELRLDKMSKKGQVNLLEVIKWILALILIWAFLKAITGS